MHIILGGNGHIGSALAQALLSQGEVVTIVSRHSSSEARWREIGAELAVADVRDTSTLTKILQQGTRLFLLNPPADPQTDTDVEERKSVASILAAIKHSSLERIVAISTYGAQQGERIGDLGVLYEMEQELSLLSIPFSVIRAAYYMTNWDFSLQTAQQDGIIHTFFPPNLELPMVAPQDIGHFAARLLTEPIASTKLYHFEGPQRYSSLHVAQAFSLALKKQIQVAEVPQNQWKNAMQEIGFSRQAAESFAGMTQKVIEGEFPPPEEVVCGTTSLKQYIAELVKNAPSA